jgi:hypothetical protein
MFDNDNPGSPTDPNSPTQVPRLSLNGIPGLKSLHTPANPSSETLIIQDLFCNPNGLNNLKKIQDFQNELYSLKKEDLLKDIRKESAISTECLFYEIEKMVNEMQYKVREKDLDMQKMLMGIQLDKLEKKKHIESFKNKVITVILFFFKVFRCLKRALGISKN